MHETPVKIQYKSGYIQGGYSFSIKNNIIFLPDYVKNLENERVLVAVQYVAIRARHHYVAEVSRLKASGEIVNTFYIKQDAGNKAKDEVQVKFSDVWDEVERTYKILERLKPSAKITTTISHKEPESGNTAHPCKGRKYVVAVVDSDTLAQWTSCEGAQFVADLKRLIRITS